MGIIDSVKSTMRKVTGTAARVELELASGAITPGQNVPVTVLVKNGPADIEVREVVLDLHAIEEIDAPRAVDYGGATEDMLDDIVQPSKRKTPEERLRSDLRSFRTTSKTFSKTIGVGKATKLEANDKRTYEGKFKFPTGVQPTYEGTYCKHFWRIRARVDILGKDPNSGWSKIVVRSQTE
jgi:hypothetical protein